MAMDTSPRLLRFLSADILTSGYRVVGKVAGISSTGPTCPGGAQGARLPDEAHVVALLSQPVELGHFPDHHRQVDPIERLAVVRRGGEPAERPRDGIQAVDLALELLRRELDVLPRALRPLLHRLQERGGEPAGRVRVRHAGLRPLVIAPGEVPGLIDELPVLAALATHGGEITVTGAAELRVKESDRIAALVAGLQKTTRHGITHET